MPKEIKVDLNLEAYRNYMKSEDPEGIIEETTKKLIENPDKIDSLTRDTK